MMIGGCAFFAFVLLVVRPFGDATENPEKELATEWNVGIAQLGISPVYPPEEDFYVGDILAVVSGLALAGARFLGAFRSYRGGHRLNAAVLKALLSDRSAFEIVETTRRERGRQIEMVAVNAPVFAPWDI